MQTDDKFSERLSERMKEHGFNQSSLAKQLRSSQSTVNRWLNGSQPRGRMMEDLCVALSVTEEWLRTGEGNMMDVPAIKRINQEYSRKDKMSDGVTETQAEYNFGPQLQASSSGVSELPLLGMASAGKPGHMETFADQYIEVPGRWNAEQHYLLEVAGDSMEPEYSDGDFIIVKSLQVGEYATKNKDVISIDVDGAVLKRLVYEKVEDPNSTLRRAKPHLISLNADYDEHIPVDADTPIRGIVVGKINSAE